MRVRVLYFAAVRDLAGRAEETLEVPEGVGTVGALARTLEQHLPALAGRLVPAAGVASHVRIARNEEFAADADPIEDGDVIALIPPVAGGS